MVLLGKRVVIIFLKALLRLALMLEQIYFDVFHFPVMFVVIIDLFQSCGVLFVCLLLKPFASLG